VVEERITGVVEERITGAERERISGGWVKVGADYRSGTGAE